MCTGFGVFADFALMPRCDRQPDVIALFVPIGPFCISISSPGQGLVEECDANDRENRGMETFYFSNV